MGAAQVAMRPGIEASLRGRLLEVLGGWGVEFERSNPAMAGKFTSLARRVSGYGRL
jgi:hypothetical protein